MSRGPVADDPFGVRSLTVDDVRRRPGTKWQAHPGRLAAWVADMDFPIAPAVRDRLVEVATTDVGYPHWPGVGVSPLRELFVERMTQRFAWTPDLDRVRELAEVMQGVQLAVHHLTRPGDGVVVHTPAYHPFLSTLRDAGRRLVPVPWHGPGDTGATAGFDHDELDDRLLRDAGARLLILCHPHNPTGTVFARAELERIGEIACRHDLTIVSDEVHADLVHAPARHVPIASIDPEVAARTVTVTSASKAFNLAGLRWAVMHVGVDALHADLTALPSHYLGMPNLMAVAATEAAWRHGDAWLAEVLAVLDENRRALVDLVADHLPGVAYRVPDATYLAWLDCRAIGLGDDPAATFRERGVELSPGPQFGDEGRGFARLNLATSPQVLAAVVAAMAG